MQNKTSDLFYCLLLSSASIHSACPSLWPEVSLAESVDGCMESPASHLETRFQGTGKAEGPTGPLQPSLTEPTAMAWASPALPTPQACLVPASMPFLLPFPLLGHLLISSHMYVGLSLVMCR